MFLKLASLFVFVASASAVIPDYVPEEVVEVINALHDTCMPAHGVTQADIDNYQLTDNSPKMMCYIKCMLQGSNWMKSDGSIDTNSILQAKVAKYENMKALVDSLVACGNVPAGNHECEKAYNFLVCYQQADPEHFFLP